MLQIKKLTKSCGTVVEVHLQRFYIGVPIYLCYELGANILYLKGAAISVNTVC